MAATVKLFSLFFLLLILGCSSTPTGRSQLKLMSSSQMDTMGDQSFSEMKKNTKISHDARKNEYVRCVSYQLLRTLGRDPAQWEVVVFDDAQINAFALPGKNIGVYTGILGIATDQAELAAVLGHEIGHVDANHGNERVSQNILVSGGLNIAQIALAMKGNENGQLIMAGLGLGAQFGILLPYSRKHESEADLIGLKYMARAGFDPRGSVRLWEKMAKAASQGPEFVSTHPNPSTRIRDLNAQMSEAMQLYQQSASKPSCHL